MTLPGALRNTRSRLCEFEGALDTASTLARWLVLFVPVAVVYLATGNYGPYSFIDAAAAFHPPWHLVHHGHLWVDDETLRLPMFVPDDSGHLVSNRTPGLIFFAVPFYAVLSWGTAEPTAAPATVAASLATACAAANIALLLETVLTPRAARIGAALAALGTSLWSVAAAEYLSHGLNVMFLSFALLSLRSRRDVLAGLFLAAAIFTRPHLAVVALVLGLGAARHHRARSLLAVGVPSVVGLTGVLAYNKWIYGRFDIRGGYDDYVNPTATPDALLLWDNVTNVIGTFVSGPRGILTLSPFLVLLIPGLAVAWRRGPWWTRWAAIAGGIYMLVQLRIQNGPEGYLGGLLIYSYRYSIEWIFLTGVLLGAAWDGWVASRPNARRWFAALAVISVWIHAVGALFYDLLGSAAFHMWLAWSPAAALSDKPLVIQLSSALALALVLVGVASPSGRDRGETVQLSER